MWCTWLTINRHSCSYQIPAPVSPKELFAPTNLNTATHMNLSILRSCNSGKTKKSPKHKKSPSICRITEIRAQGCPTQQNVSALVLAPLPSLTVLCGSVPAVSMHWAGPELCIFWLALILYEMMIKGWLFVVRNFQLDQAYKLLIQKSQATKGDGKNQPNDTN